MANHSTFRIGGPARYFIIVKSKGELMEAIEFAKESGLPFFVLGGGSNILFRDEGYDGIIIKIQNSELKIGNSGVEAGAGVPFGRLINFSIENGLAGLEWGTGIPGTVGGGVAGNCGAYGHSISEFVKPVKIFDGNGAIKTYSAGQCGFAYRGSSYKQPDNPVIICEV